MSLKTATIQTIMNELAQHPKGVTAELLVERTGYSLPTVRSALATGKTMGIAGKLPSRRPAVYVPINRAEFDDNQDVKVIEVPVEVPTPYPETPYITLEEQSRVKHLTEDRKSLDKTNLLHAILLTYHQVSPHKKHELIKSLYNIAEYLRLRDFPDELKIEDIKIKPIRRIK